MVEKWHRRLGLGVFAFLLLFVVSGVALQHAARLGLGDSYVGSAAVLRLYGAAPDSVTDYMAGRRRVSHAGQFLYLDGAPVSGVRMSGLRGAVETGGALWVAGDGKLWLLTARGEILDEFSAGGGLPDRVLGVAAAAGGIVIRGLRGVWFTPAAGRDSAPEWRPYTARRPEWPSPGDAAAAPAMRRQILAHARAHFISWERLLIDLHSGRLFGVVGVVVADIAAGVLLLLAAMGLFLWGRRKTSARP